MNAGHILGMVRHAGRPVADALIGLDWVRGGNGPLTLYGPDADSTSDRLRSLRRGLSTETAPPAVNLNTTTSSGGAFILSFQWWGGDIGVAIDALRCQIFVLVEERTATRVTMRLRGRYTRPMITSVSLSQVSSGLISNPTQLGDQIGMGVDVYTVLREIRRPMIGLTVAPPSPDMYALLAGFEINL
ncbi:Hypothetical protein A7982_02439 [Minicystis rosea]|nr:Hypothetical protein A7982_02439 [Minicystis rosea]